MVQFLTAVWDLRVQFPAGACQIFTASFRSFFYEKISDHTGYTQKYTCILGVIAHGRFELYRPMPAEKWTFYFKCFLVIPHMTPPPISSFEAYQLGMEKNYLKDR